MNLTQKNLKCVSAFSGCGSLY